MVCACFHFQVSQTSGRWYGECILWSISSAGHTSVHWSGSSSIWSGVWRDNNQQPEYKNWVMKWDPNNVFGCKCVCSAWFQIRFVFLSLIVWPVGLNISVTCLPFRSVQWEWVLDSRISISFWCVSGLHCKRRLTGCQPTPSLSCSLHASFAVQTPSTRYKASKTSAKPQRMCASTSSTL